MRTACYTAILTVLLALSGQDSSASLVLPDAEFSFSAPTLDAKEATDAIGTALAQLQFKITRNPRVRDDGFFRAEFKKAPYASVSLSGRVSCVHVGIYTSARLDLKQPEAAKREASEIYKQLVASLRAVTRGISLFKSPGGEGSCEEAL